MWGSTGAVQTGAPAAVELLLACLQFLRHELLLFASFWFILGALDELAIDGLWVVLRLAGKAKDGTIRQDEETRPLMGRAAILVPAWQESEVIGLMIAHTLRVWPQDDLTLFVGCYRNDPGTVAAAKKGTGGDRRVRLVIHEKAGPTTKADCLNRLYAALTEEETRSGSQFRTVTLHDAEDMVHPAALGLIDRALAEVDFVQLPVRPEPQPRSPWVAGHYSDEFTEAHAKALVVRNALGAGIPAAGVGCGFSRAALARLASRSAGGPFAADSLTEDYELGLLVSREGKSRFLRVRDHLGELVATRAYFPGRLEESVRQKARWIHGIAFQGWDRMGWSVRVIEIWMALRDRRGPLTAIVLAAAYTLLLIETALAICARLGWHVADATDPLLEAMLAISFASFAWRALFRFGFTAREYGLGEGVRAVLRIPVANVIAILAGRRAISAYVHSLRGGEVGWDKTRHSDHPTSGAYGTVGR